MSILYFMTCGEEFWWNWGVNAVVAIGTIGAVFVALFGKAIRHFLFPPQLRLKLLNPLGEKTVFGSSEGSRSEGRFYHIRVSNKRRLSPAKATQVFLMRIEKEGPDGILQIKWSGDLPLRWRHQEIFSTARTIGTYADCDFCSVISNKVLQLHPLIEPYNLEYRYSNATKFVASLLARSDERDTPIMRIEISWDGEWHPGDKEMQQHLKVKELD